MTAKSIVPSQCLCLLTTAKEIGETISLRMIAKGDVTIEGATGIFTNDKDIDYTLTEQTIRIRGNVTKLDCSCNQLTSLDVSKNTALTDLDCYVNQLRTLDVSYNTALEVLTCYGNQLTSLDVSKNTALTDLDCDDNELTSLDVSKNTALTELNCSNNELMSLDVSKNTALTDLDCCNNQLTSLDVSNTALTDLDCAENQLTSLDVSKNTALTDLDCCNNQLRSLDLSKNTALTDLDCTENCISVEAMVKLINSLPQIEEGVKNGFFVINTKAAKEGNVCTKSQVDMAKGKGWKIYDCDRANRVNEPNTLTTEADDPLRSRGSK